MNPQLLMKLIAFPLMMGVTFNIAAYTVHYFSPSAAAAWRFGLAAVLMFLILAGKEKLSGQKWKQNGWMYVLLGVVGVFGFNSLFFIGMKLTTPTNGSLIMATNPIVTMLLARRILRTAISREQASGAIISLLGVILVLTQGSLQALSQMNISLGDLLILAGNVCWALYGVWGRGFLRNSSSLATTTYPMLIGAFLLMLLASFQPAKIPLEEIPVGAWLGILFMAVGTTVLGYLWWNQAIAAIGANRTAIFFNLVPVVTMLTSLITVHEITWTQIAGAVLVIGGVLVTNSRLRLFVKAVEQ